MFLPCKNAVFTSDISMKRKHLVLLLLLPLCLSGIAQTIYVSTSGDDNNPGTESQPLASISGARDKIKEMRSNGLINDTVFVRIKSGTYYISEPIEFKPEDSGTANGDIFIRKILFV